jgi:mRNA interferase HigB
MHVIARKMLKDFWERHSDAEQPLRAWFTETTSAAWRQPADIKRRYPTSSFLSENRIVFNIKGNSYRLVVHVRYDLGRIYIRFIGTHAEYDRINAATV